MSINILGVTLKSQLKNNFLSYFYLFGIFLLAASLPYSKFLMSVSQIILLLSWLFNGNLSEKLKLFTKNKTALIITAVFFLHLIGLIYTSDFNYGLEDVKKKIPLLLLPLLFSTSQQFSKKIFEKILLAFVISVTTASFVSFFVLLGYTSKEILQPQQASIFMSHIRFGLLISMAIIILVYLLHSKKSLFVKTTIVLLISWLVLFLIMLESATGLVCTGVIFAILAFIYILKTKKISVKIGLLAIFILGWSFAIKTFTSIVNNIHHVSPINKKQLPLFTENGNTYSHDTVHHEIENGNYVWLYVCEKELVQEWNKKSAIDYNGKDLSENEIKYTLIRFLTSKGYTKDSLGINMLSEQEIKAIEKGIPNVNFIGIFNPTARIQKIVWEINSYMKGGNPSGHSVPQRFEFWKAAVGIIKDNYLFGVGTGDVEAAFNERYKKINSYLTQKWRLRSHNQFLSIGVAFGIIGMGYFIFSLFFPLVYRKGYRDYFYSTFFIIAFLSMLAEDTLETQAGVTFFAFFNSLFLFSREKEKVQTVF